MKTKSNSIIVVLCGIWASLSGQMQSYDHLREIQGITDEWHKIELPIDIFSKVSQSLSDIRIFGITKSQDTIEAPYIHRIAAKQNIPTAIPFKKLNAVHNKEGYFYTFEITDPEIINQIQLDFGKKNFDWRLKLEGSQDQKEWFTIVDDYRIVSIKNKITDYQFTKIKFDDVHYKYYRILIRSKEKPELTKAKIFKVTTSNGFYANYTIKDKTVFEDKQDKQTRLILDMENPSRISYIHIQPTDQFEYYRSISIQYVSDSLKTEKGWKYSYRNLVAGTLSSFEKNEFYFESTTIKQLRIIIHNRDNEPLTFDDIMVSGAKHELIARFTKPASYFLTYGNSSKPKPDYDIKRFTSNIPKKLTVLEVGPEHLMSKKKLISEKPLFENKIWLWSVMGIVILLLGGFSIKMMNQKN